MMYELRVLNGLHQGAALPLVGEQWLIGADADHDLALYDPGVAARHCRLTRSADGWTLSAEDSLINDDEGHAHSLTELAPNQTFALGNVWLCLAPAEDAWPLVPVAHDNASRPAAFDPRADEFAASAPLEKVSARAGWFSRRNALLVGVLLSLLGGAWAWNRSSVSQPTAPPAPPIASPAKAAHVEPPAPGKTRLASREDTRRLLNTLLSDRLLTDVRIEDSVDGLTLAGGLKGDALSVYQRMLQRFHERYESAVPIVDSVVPVSSGLPFVIVQVISGANGHLVTDDGHRLYVGDELNGLRLTRIDDQRIEFEGDQHYEVRW
nr:FHA domain-containing protein [Pseudomonas gingeri]